MDAGQNVWDCQTEGMLT